MPVLIYDSTNFKGLATSHGATNGQVVQCDNYDAVIDTNATLLNFGMLTKFPDSKQLGDTITGKISRGLYVFVPSLFGSTGLFKYIQAFSDGTIRQYVSSSDSWVTIGSGYNENNPFDFDTYVARNTLFFSNGAEPVSKWNDSWSSTISISDKGDTATALTGTLSFTEDSDIVTGASTAFTTELSPGNWVRKSSSDTYYEVNSITSNTEFRFVTAYAGTTGDGASGGSEKAPYISDGVGKQARFVKIWNDRLFLASGETDYFMLNEDATYLLLEDDAFLLT